MPGVRTTKCILMIVDTYSLSWVKSIPTFANSWVLKTFMASLHRCSLSSGQFLFWASALACNVRGICLDRTSVEYVEACQKPPELIAQQLPNSWERSSSEVQSTYVLPASQWQLQDRVAETEEAGPGRLQFGTAVPCIELASRKPKLLSVKVLCNTATEMNNETLQMNS